MAKFVMEIEIDDDSPIRASLAFSKAAEQWEGMRECLGVEEETMCRVLGEPYKVKYVVKQIQ